MQDILLVILSSIAVALSISTDVFAAAFGYGNTGIKIPWKSAIVINTVGNLFLGVSLLLGGWIEGFLPNEVTSKAAFLLLFTVGLIKLLNSFIKSIIRKYGDFQKEIKFSFFNLLFILNLYANPEEADLDKSKTISVKEAVVLSAILSIDCIGVGLGTAMSTVNGIAIFIASVFSQLTAVLLGAHIGHKVSNKIHYDFSWLSGVVLIALAFFG